MEEQIQELLNSIPQGVTYTTFPEDLEPEDISQERITLTCDEDRMRARRQRMLQRLGQELHQLGSDIKNKLGKNFAT